MPKESAGPEHVGGLALFLFAAPAVVEPGLLALAAGTFPEVADASPLGRLGTIGLAVAAAVLSAAGAGLALRDSNSRRASAIAILLGVAGGLLALIACVFLFEGGALLILAILLLHAVFSIAMIIRAVTRSRPVGGRR